LRELSHEPKFFTVAGLDHHQERKRINFTKRTSASIETENKEE